MAHFLAGQNIYLFTSASRLAPGTHPATFALGLGVKHPGLEADHSPVADMKDEWICISNPPILLLACTEQHYFLPYDICYMMYLDCLGYLSSAHKHSPSQTENFALGGYYGGKYWPGW